MGTPSLLDSIRRTIEERNLFSVRSRVHFLSALRSADNNGQGTPSSRKGYRNFKTPNTGNPLDNRLIRMRNKVIQEIIKTEEDYVSQLRTIRNDFMEDSEIKICFSKRDFNAIFNNIPVLLEVNERLLYEIKSSEESSTSVMNSSLQSLASAFHNYTPFLKLYSTYASNYQQADDLLQRLMSQNSELRSLIRAKEATLNNTLQSYLITPVQRIPRYKLLLQQLVSFIGTSGKSDPDVQSLLESVKNLDQVALHMNEMIRQHENSCKLIDINLWMGKNYHGNLVEPGRYYIKSGTVLKPPTVMFQQSLTSNNQFFLVLLSDQVISCKIKSELGSKGCLQPTLVLPLKKCEAQIVNDLYAEITCDNECIRFTLTDPDDLIQWVNGINDAAKSLKRRSATLKKPSSNAQPIKKEQIKNIIKAKKGIKRRFSCSGSPAPSPGKLRKFFNISEKLDEFVDYLSPIRFTPETRRHYRIPNSAPSEMIHHRLPEEPADVSSIRNRIRLLPLHSTRHSNGSCIIL